eukprot:gene11939-14102_t
MEGAFFFQDVDVLEAAATSESPIVDQLQIETLQKTHTEQLREDEIRGAVAVKITHTESVVGGGSGTGGSAVVTSAGISGGRASTGGGIGGAQRRAARASLSNLQTNAPVTKQAAQVEMQSLEKDAQATWLMGLRLCFWQRVPGNFCENLENSRQQQQQVKLTARQESIGQSRKGYAILRGLFGMWELLVMKFIMPSARKVMSFFSTWHLRFFTTVSSK